MPGETRITLVDGLHLRARTPTGFTLDLDSKVHNEPPLAGPSPMEVELVALGSCTAMDAISILRKMREEITAYDVRLENERATAHPRVFTRIVMTHTFRGRSVDQRNVERAVQLTMARYCPVFAMLSPTVEIVERYEIIDEETGGVTTGEITHEAAIAAAAITATEA